MILDKHYSTTRLAVRKIPIDIVNGVEQPSNQMNNLEIEKIEWHKREGGFRTKGFCKKSYEGKPLISIVTVVYNGEKYLEETIKSVITQTYDNVEYIIIDGGSTDGTLDIIRKYDTKIDYWISEKDKGIYDAMNKGIDYISGEWINFMNAGDVFYESSTIKEIFSNELYTDMDFIYGDLEINYGKFKRFEKAKQLENIWKGMVFSHQSCFISSKFHKSNKYSLNYNIGGDFEFFYNAFKKDKKFQYIHQIISTMDVEGLSDSNRFKSINQHHRIVNKHNFSIQYNMYYSFLYVDQFLRKIFKIILPNSVINKIKINKS